MRFVVIGTSGSGKSTFAKTFANTCGVTYVELDELFWAPNWTPHPTEVFKERVVAATEPERWVVDGNYSVVRAVLWPKATDIVWLNFSRFTVFSRILRRTVMRAITRQDLWAGNKESLLRAFLSKDSILLWSFSTFRKNQVKFATLRASAEFSHLNWHELRTPAEAKRFLHAQKHDV